MNEDLITQLNDSDPVRRRQAIVALTNSGDPRVPGLLSKLLNQEPDPRIREVAQRAIEYLNQKQSISALPSKGPARSQAAELPEQEQGIATDHKEEARGYLNNAYGSQTNGDRQPAQAWLARALHADPTLRHEPEVRQLARDITGLIPDEAIRRLMDADREARGATAKSENNGCFIAILELVILFVLIAIGSILTFNLMRQNSDLVFRQVSNSVSQVQARELLRQVLNEPSSFLPGFAAIVGISGVVAYIFWNVLIFLFSTIALGGVGGWVEFMNTMLGVQIAATILGFVPLLITLANIQHPSSSLANLTTTVYGLSGLGTICAQVYFCSRVMKFDVARGFVAVVLSPFILGCGCTLILLLTTMIGGVSR